MRRRTGTNTKWGAGQGSPPPQGYSLIEVVFVAGLVVTLSAVALPNIQRALDEFRTVGAVRYMAARLERTRAEALARSADVALRFVDEGITYRYAVYVDGNANGVRTADISSGEDRLASHEERLSDQFAGVDLGVVPELPGVDSGAPPGVDPIKLGSGNMATFTPDGTATPGSLYVLGPRGLQFTIRIVGETGRTRILRFDSRNRTWKPL
jgi:type II secretory pathway pseudopilin PulG